MSTGLEGISPQWRSAREYRVDRLRTKVEIGESKTYLEGNLFMKTLALLTLLAASHAVAESNEAPHAYWCTADGYDHGDRIRSISGRLEPTRKKARESALRLCRQLYMGCQLRSCFQQR